ncbi:uncharacterized protein LTR77_009433 [Saxophila tyrrhenica]|uniref:Uncharacterized protein n=1 Tax=Saxophila tyrrhenica TaxID=1690608 RepID=A0AAV9P1Q7_9PEZI|nr:hypothetical protein LTR77_009433 [Saxophila tyrrhenica]
MTDLSNISSSMLLSVLFVITSLWCAIAAISIIKHSPFAAAVIIEAVVWVLLSVTAGCAIGELLINIVQCLEFANDGCSFAEEICPLVPVIVAALVLDTITCMLVEKVVLGRGPTGRSPLAIDEFAGGSVNAIRYAAASCANTIKRKLKPESLSFRLTIYIDPRAGVYSVRIHRPSRLVILTPPTSDSDELDCGCTCDHGSLTESHRDSLAGSDTDSLADSDWK